MKKYLSVIALFSSLAYGESTLEIYPSDSIIGEESLECSLYSEWNEYSITDFAPVKTPELKEGHISYKQLISYQKEADLSYMKSHEPGDKQEDVEAFLNKGGKMTFFGENNGVVLEKSDGSVSVVFKGTSTLQDVGTDLSFWGFYSEKTGLSGHRGFVSAYDSYRDQVKGILENIALRRAVSLSDLDLSFVGHSLGGALAQVGAADYAKQGFKCNMVAFAGPRALTIGSAEEVEATGNLKTAVRVSHGRDPVPFSLPEGVTGYQGLGSHVHYAPCLDEQGEAVGGLNSHRLGHYERTLLARNQNSFSVDLEEHKAPKSTFRKVRSWVNRKVEEPLIKGFYNVTRAVKKTVSGWASKMSSWFTGR